jgi:hypothetical protein
MTEREIESLGAKLAREYNELICSEEHADKLPPDKFQVGDWMLQQLGISPVTARDNADAVHAAMSRYLRN